MLIRMWFIIIMCCVVFASGSEPNDGSLRKEGSKALEFKMTGLLSLSQHSGGAITYKSFVANNKARRIGISLDGTKDWDSGEYERINYEVYYDTSYYDTTTYDIDAPDFSSQSSLFFQSIKYKDPFHSVSLLYGIGGKLGYVISDRGINNRNLKSKNTSLSTKNKISESRLYLGLTALLGFEWYIDKNISFHSEYQTDLLLGKKVRIEERDNIQYDGDWSKSKSKVSGYYFDIADRVEKWTPKTGQVLSVNSA